MSDECSVEFSTASALKSRGDDGNQTVDGGVPCPECGTRWSTGRAARRCCGFGLDREGDRR